MVGDTPPSQDVSTHQIWNSYLKEYRRYGPDTKAGRTDGQCDYYMPTKVPLGGIKMSADIIKTMKNYPACRVNHPNLHKIYPSHPVSKFLSEKNVIIFLNISLNMCFGCSKEPSQRDGSFDYPQHMLWMRNKIKFQYLVISGGLNLYGRNDI